MLRTLLAPVCALLILSPALRADPFTDALDDLQIELTSRLAEDFGGTLDKAAKKQKKAVEQSLKFLAKEAKSASDDVKTLTKCFKKLGKAYADEFAGGGGLGNLVTQSLDGLRTDASDRRTELQYALPTLSPANVEKSVQKLHDQAADALGGWFQAPDTNARFKLIKTATKALDKAEAKAAKSNGQGVYLFIATDGGTPIESDEPFAEWNADTGELQIYGQRLDQFGGLVTVAVVMEGITGPGTYAFTGDGWSGFYEVGSQFNSTRYDIVAGSGSLVIETLDIAGSVVAGTFAFDAYNDGNMTTLEFPNGAFRLTTIYE